MVKNIWVCIENAGNNYSSFAPEVPGCLSTGSTVEQTRENMVEALRFHLEGLMEDGHTLVGIAGTFPEKEAQELNGELWAMVRVELSGAGVKAGG